MKIYFFFASLSYEDSAIYRNLYLKSDISLIFIIIHNPTSTIISSNVYNHSVYV